MGDKRTISFPDYGLTWESETGTSLLEVIRQAGLPLRSDCGGVGSCGKCQVLVNGVQQLACQCYVATDVEVTLSAQASEADYAILTEHGFDTAMTAGADVEAGAGARAEVVSEAESGAGTGADAEADEYAIAIDIGTTTVVGNLLACRTGHVLATFAQLNQQRSYGADVISRIDATMNDASQLQALITSQIDRSVRELLSQADILPGQVRRVVIAGNTTMIYILLGLPCRSLGLAPYQPEFIYPIRQDWRNIFNTRTLYCDCFIPPFISAFVGGDVVAGLCSLDSADDFILMDMGTNGEMAFRRGSQLLCTATAAGPAFEGGSIECGSGSITGAISVVEHQQGQWQLQTIGAAPPTSICGSGILDLMAVLLREGLVDRSGLLLAGDADGRLVLADAEQSGSGRPVYFSQADVRQFQLAKSAVRSGLEVLLAEMGDSAPAQVFLAGGFGQHLRPASAMAVGLLPEELTGRIQAIGNSSLSGAIRLCLSPAARESINALPALGRELNLASNQQFNTAFMENMAF
ncbi:MAG: ASKHA domain-containing protein [Coriobacteriales bacterium]|nr:ASKHA domain-containing protein [Coriobacteriales bacterium]